MRTFAMGSAAALLAMAVASPAAAQDQDFEDNTITVQSPLLHPAAGLMNDHMHEGGEIMVGLRFERIRHSGANRSGTDRIDDAAILAAGYSVRTEAMTMDMVMLDLMYAPNDDITLMIMPHYMWHSMDMVGIDPDAGHGGHDGHGGHGEGGHADHGHALGFGEVHSHSAGGFGDTLVSASYRLVRERRLNVHATLGLWVPTGPDDMRNHDGTFVHYGMQPGSGTWDLEPSVTMRGGVGPVGWGAQGAYLWRMSEENGSGFRFGDKARATAWVSHMLGASAGATARLEYVHEGQIEGHYNGPHHHSSPPDLQENYGGDTVSAAVGVNWLLPAGVGGRPQLGAEFSVPLYQNLNGIQAPQDWRLSVALTQTF